MKIKSTAFLISSFFVYGFCQAQSTGPGTLNACGGSAVSGGNTYEWSVAEMTMVSTLINGNILVTQGVLQPYEETAGIEENGQHFFDAFQVYPVPTGNFVYLQPHFETGGKLDWALFDAQGKQIGFHSVRLIQGNEMQSLDMSALPAANYFLRVWFGSGHGTVSTAYTVQKIF